VHFAGRQHQEREHARLAEAHRQGAVAHDVRMVDRFLFRDRRRFAVSRLLTALAPALARFGGDDLVDQMHVLVVVVNEVGE
jgi:hypothetical protein